MESLDFLRAAYNEGKTFTAFDLETTGLDAKSAHIVEIGALRFDKRGTAARFATLVNPGVPIPPEAEKINGISDEMLGGYPGIEKVMPDFLYFVRNTVLIAHNAPFDCGFINESLARLHGKGNAPFPALPNPVACTLLISRETFPGRKSYSLQNMAADLSIPSLEAHRAGDDARLCMEILLKCLDIEPV